MKNKVIFNQFLDFNEKNFGLVKLRAKYPDETDDQIYERLLGRKLISPKKVKQNSLKVEP